MNKKRLYQIIFPTIFLLLGIIIILIINYFYHIEHKEELKVATQIYSRAYDTAYIGKEELSKIIFDGVKINGKLPQRLARLDNATKEQKDKIREDIYQDLKFRYKKLQTIGISQIQIHLPNNESFLRMYKPKKYGDDLTNIRSTVTYVNQHHKKVDSMEIGRIYYGLRFVYPIFYNNRYVGSIEISYSASTITSSIMRQYYVLSNFFIKKSVADRKTFKNIENNYILSNNENYYFDKNAIKEVKNISRKDISELLPTNTIRLKLIEMGAKNSPSSLYNKNMSLIYTVIPILNSLTLENIAFLVIRSISNHNQHYIYTIYLLSILLLALVVYFIYIIINKKYELEEAINEALAQNIKQQQILQQQNKLASMGEMIGAIAHQWRQPLNELAISIQNLRFDYSEKLINEEFITSFILHNKKTIMFMSDTIDDFRNFFRIDKSREDFQVRVAIDMALSMLSAQLKNNNIKLNITGDDFIFNGFKSELQQVILNIINNAKDTLISNNIQNPTINIDITNYIITIKDNGGGVPQNIIDRVFEPYFTTKEQGKGTGIGLYMSKIIIEDNMGGKLSVVNSDNGAIFIIKL